MRYLRYAAQGSRREESRARNHVHHSKAFDSDFSFPVPNVPGGPARPQTAGTDICAHNIRPLPLRLLQRRGCRSSIQLQPNAAATLRCSHRVKVVGQTEAFLKQDFWQARVSLLTIHDISRRCHGTRFLPGRADWFPNGITNECDKKSIDEWQSACLPTRPFARSCRGSRSACHDPTPPATSESAPRSFGRR